jgi:hypothetical protein
MWLYVFSLLHSSLFRSFDKRAKVREYGSQFFSWRSANQPSACRKKQFCFLHVTEWAMTGFQGVTGSKHQSATRRKKE